MPALFLGTVDAFIDPQHYNSARGSDQGWRCTDNFALNTGLSYGVRISNYKGPRLAFDIARDTSGGDPKLVLNVQDGGGIPLSTHSAFVNQPSNNIDIYAGGMRAVFSSAPMDIILSLIFFFRDKSNAFKIHFYETSYSDGVMNLPPGFTEPQFT
jgi:hypothetical protein